MRRPRGNGVTLIILAVVIGMLGAFLLAIPGAHFSDLVP
jgi:hypothetical protein